MTSYDKNKEEEFVNLEKSYQSRKKNSTGIESVLYFLIENRDKKIWWWSYEFVGQTTKRGDWLSHRAPARASDLALKYPELVEDRRIGRLKVYRLRMENKQKIKDFLGMP